MTKTFATVYEYYKAERRVQLSLIPVSFNLSLIVTWDLVCFLLFTTFHNNNPVYKENPWAPKEIIFLS